MEDEDNYLSLSIDDRLAHKLWKARQNAYEELAKVFAQAEGPKAQVFRDHFESMRKAPLESNAAALDAALHALHVYVESSELALKLRSAMLGSLIEKGLGAARAPTRTKCVEILLEFIAIDVAEPVVAELGTFMNHKQPKIIAAAVNAMTEIVRNFGVATAGVKSIIKFLPTIFQHADKNVRAEGSVLVLEIARWIGPAVTAGFEGLKPVQVKELQDAIARLPAEAPRPLRWRRAEQPSDPSAVPQGCAMEVEETASRGPMDNSCGSMGEIIDAYALSEPVDVLERIPPGFQEGLDSSKWKERKEALEALLIVLKVPKIKEGHFGPLLTQLIKKVADVNVTVAAVAAQCIEALAKGLRKSFGPHRGEAIPALLERCKEKNKAVVEALRAALDSTIYCISGGAEIAETYSAFLKHKNPQVKAETLSWMARAMPAVFRSTNAKKELKVITEAVIPCMDDGTVDVRDAACAVLSVLIKIEGEKSVSPFLEKVDKIKMTKVIDLAKADSSAASAAAAAIPIKAPPPATTQAKPPLAALNDPRPVNGVAPNMARVKGTTSTAKSSSHDKIVSLDSVSFATTTDRAVDIIRGLVGEGPAAGFADGNWKTRLEAMDALSGRFESGAPAEVDSEVLARFFTVHPSWRETNFQVLGRALNLLTVFAEKNSFTPAAASLLIPGSLDKIADAKLGTGVSLLLTALTEHVGLSFVVECLAEPIRSQKNPKSHAEAFNWIASALLDFGVAGLNLKALVDLVKPGITHTNPTVRTLAMKAATTLRRFLGPDLLSMFSDLPTAQLTTVEGEFAKVAADPIPVPIRRARLLARATAGNESTEAGCAAAPLTVPSQETEDLLPRNDVTSSLGALIPELGDGNWKIRKEAMDKALDVLGSSGHRIRLANHDFLSELKGRFADANKNLIIQALDLTSAVASAMGLQFERSGALRIVLGPATSTLTDNKSQVRAAALKFLSTALSVGSLASMAGPLGASLAADSPNLRKELLTWLADNVGSLGKASEDERATLVVAIIHCLQDRTIEVRKAASACIDALLDVLETDTVLRMCQSTKPALLSQVKSIADNHKPTPQIAASSLPPKTPQKTAPAPSSSRTPKNGEAVAEPAGQVFLAWDLQLKQNRAEGETRGTGLRWLFDAPRAEFCDHLKQLMSGAIAPHIVKLLFADDFRDAVQAMGMIDACIAAGREKEGVVGNVDLLLKYLTIRLFDTNTTVLIRTIDLVEHLLAVIDESNLRLSEAEATCFLPHFVLRAGELKEPIKSRIRGIYRQLCRVYPASKIFAFLMEGLRSKSSRARVECLNEMAVLISRNGLMVVQASKHVPVIAGYISDRDSQVRNASLDVLVQLHELLGDSLYKNMASLPPKDLDLFQERLRRSREKSLVPGANASMDIDEGPPSVSPEEEPAALSEQPDGYKPAAEPDIPRVFSLDPHQVGSPVRSAALRNSLCATPVNPFSHGAPTPALPSTHPFYHQSYCLEDPLDRVIQQINSSTDLECIAALQRLDEMIPNPSLLVPKLDALVNALVVRLHECTHSMIEVDASLKSRLCRYVTNALVLLVTEKSGIVSGLDAATVALLLRETLLSLVTGQIGGFEDKEQLSRALNALLVKCLENCHRNSCYRSLLGLLKQAFRLPPSAEDKYPEFVMKCLWKLSKVLSEDIKTGKIDVLEVLRDIHGFFTVLPPMEWKNRAAQNLPLGDLPLRTVKTILNEFATSLRDQVIPVVRRLENCEQSFVTSYMRAMLMANNVDVSGLDFARFPLDSLNSPTVLDGNDGDPSQQQQQQLSMDQLEELLKDICSKICSKPNTRAGLAELYELQKNHSYAAEFIDMYLQKLGTFFYKYIRRNLMHIEAEHRLPEPTPSGNTPIESYKHKLAQMQMQILGKGGMVSTRADFGDEGSDPQDLQGQQQRVDAASPVRNRLDSPAAKARTPLRLNAAHAESGSPSTKDSTIVSLKERLARLRQGSGSDQ